jgi:hypothetical protein
MPVVFASGAQLDANGVPVQVVDAVATPPDAQAAAPVPETAPPEPDGDGDTPSGDTEPAESAEDGDAAETPEEPVEGDAAQETTQEFNESNRGFRQRLLNENRDLRREKREDRALITYLQQQLDTLKTQPAEPEAQPQQPQALPGLPPRPQQTEYATYTEYEDALLQWHDQRRYAQYAAETQAAEQRNAQAEWQRKEDEGREKYRDYDQAVARAQFAPMVAPIVAAAMRESAAGPDLLYYLAKHPEDLAAFNKLTPYQAARWLAQLESDRFRQPTKRPSGVNGNGAVAAPPAPRPMAPVGTGAAVPVTGFREGMSLREYEAMRAQQRQRPG